MNWLNHHHAHGESLVHKLPAAPKLAIALATIVGTVLAPAGFKSWFAGVIALLLVAISVGRISPLFILKRVLLLSPFIAGVALVNVFQPAGRGQWPVVALKSILCLLTVTVVSNTTPFNRILRVLQQVRVPGLLVTTIALMHRYLFVLADEAERMRRARLSRTFKHERRFRWQTLSTIIGQLFVRASERAERIYNAMCARGWK